MPYDSQLSDEERSWSAKLARFWRGVGSAAKAGGHITGHSGVGYTVSTVADGIASGQQRKADTGMERRLTPEEQEQANRHNDAHPSHW